MPKKLTTNEFLLRLSRRDDGGLFYDYSLVEYTSCLNKIKIVCPLHGEFEQLPGNHTSNHNCRKCGSIIQTQTSIQNNNSYSTETYLLALTSIRNDKGNYYKYDKVIYKAGNKIIISCPIHGNFLQDPLEHLHSNHGCPDNECIVQKRRETSMTVYDTSHPMQNSTISSKNYRSKIKNGTCGGFSSKEANQYFRNYIKEKNYNITQVAFYDKEFGLFEWGINTDSGHVFYDFVAFEEGHRGDKNYIIEIAEYHGPWHYTADDVLLKGNKKATPFAKDITTIKDSFEHDKLKYNHAKLLTDNVNVIWSTYHNKKDIK